MRGRNLQRNCPNCGESAQARNFSEAAPNWEKSSEDFSQFSRWREATPQIAFWGGSQRRAWYYESVLAGSNVQVLDMPFFSIVIPVYGTADHLPRAVELLQHQKFSDWEAVIVDDGSPDNARQVIADLASRDSRIVPVFHDHNQGTHLARGAGAARASGQWVLFLDADDELAAGSLEQLAQEISERPCDVLHFGAEIVGIDMPLETVAVIAKLSNTDFPALSGQEIVESSFIKPDGERQDWHVWQRVYRAELVRKAFERMEKLRLVHGEDAYEWLVIASLAQVEHFANHIRGYRYFLGRGVTTFAHVAAEQFVQLADAHAQTLAAAEKWAVEFQGFSLTPCVAGLRERTIELLAGDWYVRVAAADKELTMRHMVKLFGAVQIAGELMRLVRDTAYADWDHGRGLNLEAEYLTWYRWAVDLANGHKPTERLRVFREVAERHLRDLAHRSGVPAPVIEADTVEGLHSGWHKHSEQCGKRRNGWLVHVSRLVRVPQKILRAVRRLFSR